MAPRKSSKPKVNTGKPGRAAGGRDTGSGKGGGKPPSTGRSSGSSSRSSGPREGGPRGRPIRQSDARRSAPVAKGLGGEQIEGRQAVRELLIGQRRKVKEIWIAQDIDPAPIIDDIEQLADAARVTVLEVPRRTLEDTARSEAPQGIIAFAQPLEEADFNALMTKRNGVMPFLVAVDGVTDPGNLGAILRSCDGAGVDAVVLPRHRAVHITPTAAKSAAGAAEYVPMCIVGGLPTALKQLKDAGVWIIGLHDAADKNIFEMGSLASESVCLVLGAEGPGLSRLVRERCDLLVSIPMLGALSSLNVSAAAALATYEVVRARTTK